MILFPWHYFYNTTGKSSTSDCEGELETPLFYISPDPSRRQRRRDDHDVGSDDDDEEVGGDDDDDDDDDAH